jgi:hypothetical protein
MADSETKLLYHHIFIHDKERNGVSRYKKRKYASNILETRPKDHIYGDREEKWGT